MINEGTVSSTPLVCDPWLSEVLRNTVVVGEQEDRLIGALQLDSRNVSPGDVFIALPGVTADGRDYIDQALAMRASAVLFEQNGTDRAREIINGVPVIGIKDLKAGLGGIAAHYFGNPSDKLRIVGVTGTNGKTTVAYLLAQAMHCLGVPSAYSGTIGSGLIGDIRPAALTTADAVSMQQRLAEYVAQGARAAVLEVSSHGLHQGRANGIGFEAAVFTNLTRDHLDYHGSMANYAWAKRRLFDMPTLQQAVINIDDEFGRTLLEYCRRTRPALRVTTFGTDAADIRADCVTLSDSGTRLHIQAGHEQLDIQTPLIGDINVSNVLATVATLYAMGFAAAHIKRELIDLKAPAGRMEIFRGAAHLPSVVVDYAHTPDALERALKSLRPVCRGQLIAIFGCGGDRDRGKRALMGRAAFANADRVIITDDNPRTESPESIVEDILDGTDKAAEVIHDRRQALARAVETASADDLILLAGKGHEATQSVSGFNVELCDRAIVPEILEALA